MLVTLPPESAKPTKELKVLQNSVDFFVIIVRLHKQSKDKLPLDNCGGVGEQMLHKQSKDKLQIECTTHMVHDVIKPICSQFASFLVNYSAMCSLQTFFAASKRLHGQGNKDDSILQPPKTWATALKTSRTGDCDLFAVYLPCHTLKEFTCSRNRVLRPNGEES